jgi:hypothetical protein
MRYFQKIQFDGVANVITYDDGLKSSESEKKRLVKIHVLLEKYDATDNDCDVQGYHERDKVFDIPHRLIRTELKTATAQTAAGQKIGEIPVDFEIPVGESFKLAIKCASVAIDLWGAYEYEIVG